MSKYVISNGSRRNIVEADNIGNGLPKGTYTMKLNGFSGEWYLEKVDDFEIPKKLYGDMSIAERCKAVYKHRSRNFCLMLSGLKGSGRKSA